MPSLFLGFVLLISKIISWGPSLCKMCKGAKALLMVFCAQGPGGNKGAETDFQVKKLHLEVLLLGMESALLCW